MKILAWASSQIVAHRKRKQEDRYLKRHGVTLRCPHCEVWAHEAKTPPTIKSFGHPVAVRSECGDCGKASYWVCEAGFWFRAEQFGVHIEQETTP